MKIFVFLVTLCAFLTAHAAPSESEALALRKSYPIQVYMGACVASRAVQEQVADQARSQGFVSAGGTLAGNYLQGHEGKVWVSENEHGRFAIASQNRGLCSVFIHQGNPQELIESMEAWLPPQGSGFTFEKKVVSESEQLLTLSYNIYRDSQPLERWVITVSKQPGSGLIAVMSYDSAQT